jgi:hypothetical protein
VREVIRLNVRFVDGPLDGREEEIPEDQLDEGHPVYWPERPDIDDDTDPRQPGLDGVVEYLYEGNGKATYVGGQLEGS